MTRLIDLSMPVHREMITFPRIPPPTMLMYESWTEFAERIGAAAEGADWLTASYLIIQGDHVGTHSDGVVLDFRHKPYGSRIFVDDIDEALGKIGYTLKERDIVLIQTGASAYNTEQRYLTDHCGMTAEATRYLISKGVRLMGTDAVTFDPPVWAMFEQKHFWEAHLVMKDEDYWHIENLTNLDQLPPCNFKLSVFPIKWIGTTAAPVRAVGIIDE